MNARWRFEQDAQLVSEHDKPLCKGPIYSLHRGPERIGYIYKLVDVVALVDAMNWLQTQKKQETGT